MILPGKTLLALTLALTILLPGCSILNGRKDNRPTKVVITTFGKTVPKKQFKMGYHKPSAFVYWGTDVDKGAPCEIVITSTSLGKRVYYHSFNYSPPNLRNGYQFTGGKILEPDPFWHHKIGKYIVALYVRDRRISTDEFDILP